MVSWSELAAAEPELAERAKAAFDRSKHKTMATIRKDGSPRISGTEVDFRNGEAWLGSMPNAVKAQDLLRDSRVAVHSASAEPDEEAHKMDPDAKLAGRAVEITDPEVVAVFAEDAPPGDMHLFRLDITELVVTGVEGEPPYLYVDYWTAAGGHRRVERD
jgi:hypothetical protein